MKPLEIAEKLYSTFENSQKVQSYYGLLAVWALAETAVEGDNVELLEKCKSYLSLYPDNFEHPNYNFENYRVGGTGKAWLLAKGLFDAEKENIRLYSEYTLNAPKDDEGVLCHPRIKQWTWIDIAAFVPTFMLFSGLALNEEKYIDFAANQVFMMYERFLDKTCGLLHQTRGHLPNPDIVSPDHWGRGNGWGYIALTKLVEYLPKDSKHRPKAEKYFKSLSEALLRCQNIKGVWRQLLDCDYAWDECSSTGLITAGFGVGIRLGLLNKSIYEKPFLKALQAIVDLFINKDFSTNMSCPGCLAPYLGEERATLRAYLTAVHPTHNEGHSFGSLMFAFIEAARNGVEDLVGRSW